MVLPEGSTAMHGLPDAHDAAARSPGRATPRRTRLHKSRDRARPGAVASRRYQLRAMHAGGWPRSPASHATSSILLRGPPGIARPRELDARARKNKAHALACDFIAGAAGRERYEALPAASHARGWRRRRAGAGDEEHFASRRAR